MSPICPVCSKAKVEVWPGEAQLFSPGRVAVTLPGGETRTAVTDKLIIATGSEEVVPPIPGMDLPSVIFQRKPWP